MSRPRIKQPATVAHLLLLVDKSPATERMVTYVAGVIGRRRDFLAHFLFLMPQMPVGLLETGGSEDPTEETALNEELYRQQDAWIASAKATAKPALNELTAIMRKAGVPSRVIDVAFSNPYEAANSDRAILGFAQEEECHTIVVAHDSHSWFREMTGGHLAERLLRHAKGMAIWVVQ